jgi:hypothetical protein
MRVDADLAEQRLHAERARLVRTIGTTSSPISLSLSIFASILTNAIVVDALRPSLPFWNSRTAPGSVSPLIGSTCTRRSGTKPPSCLRRSSRYEISGLLSEGR